jgi:hypothetical protein
LSRLLKKTCTARLILVPPEVMKRGKFPDLYFQYLERNFLTKKMTAASKPPKELAKINQSAHRGQPNKLEISKDSRLTLKTR